MLVTWHFGSEMALAMLTTRHFGSEILIRQLTYSHFATDIEARQLTKQGIFNELEEEYNLNSHPYKNIFNGWKIMKLNIYQKPQRLNMFILPVYKIKEGMLTIFILFYNLNEH